MEKERGSLNEAEVSSGSSNSVIELPRKYAIAFEPQIFMLHAIFRALSSSKKKACRFH